MHTVCEMCCGPQGLRLPFFLHSQGIAEVLGKFSNRVQALQTLTVRAPHAKTPSIYTHTQTVISVVPRLRWFGLQYLLMAEGVEEAGQSSQRSSERKEWVVTGANARAAAVLVQDALEHRSHRHPLDAESVEFYR